MENPADNAILTDCPAKTLVAWSSGKDAAWTLHVLRRREDVEVVGLLTTFNESADRVSMHAVRRELVEAQAAAAGLPLWPVLLPSPCSNADYQQRMGEANVECRCIRCREYGHRARGGWEIGEPRLVRLDYEASDGREVFLSFEDDDETLFGLLRLRIQSRPVPALGQGNDGNTVLIRELHVYGPEVPISERLEGTAQHRGLGRELLAEAERIASAEFGAAQIVVLSGVGAKEYYRESGYSSLGEYMVKGL